jgi:hypothetical protein
MEPAEPYINLALLPAVYDGPLPIADMPD